MKSQQALQAGADKLVPKFRRAFLRAAERMRENVAIRELERALEAKDVAKALKAVREDELDDMLGPFGAILRDAFVKGGKVAAPFL